MNDPNLPEVMLIHRKRAMALLEGGDMVPVTNWFDASGRECDPVLAVTCVCGDPEVGWYVIDLRCFEYPTVH